VSTDAELLQTETVVDDPPAGDETPVTPEPAAQDDDAALEASLAEQTIEVPDSGAEDGKVKLVPLSAVTTVRDKLSQAKAELKDAKAAGARTSELEQQVQQLQATLQQYAPVVQAYQAMQQQPPVQPVNTEDDAEALELARDLDLYDTAGQPNVAKAKAILAKLDRRSEQKAQQAVQPLAQHSVAQQSQVMLGKALATKAPDGTQPHPDDLKAVWSRLDPSVTATLEGAKQVWIQALGLSQMAGRAVRTTTQGPTQGNRAPDGKFTKVADIPPPLHTEKAGGRDQPALADLDPKEMAFIKASGMTPEEYRKSAQSAPWLRK
jgi:hypothetical protein